MVASKSSVRAIGNQNITTAITTAKVPRSPPPSPSQIGCDYRRAAMAIPAIPAAAILEPPKDEAALLGDVLAVAAVPVDELVEPALVVVGTVVVKPVAEL